MYNFKCSGFSYISFQSHYFSISTFIDSSLSKITFLLLFCLTFPPLSSFLLCSHTTPLYNVLSFLPQAFKKYLMCLNVYAHHISAVYNTVPNISVSTVFFICLFVSLFVFVCWGLKKQTKTNSVILKEKQKTVSSIIGSRPAYLCSCMTKMSLCSSFIRT